MSPKPVRAKEARTIIIEIDHRPVSCPEGVSVLRAAELGGIAIPSLCSHKDLSAFGGCRLCMVEIEGMRGYPLACSTIVAEGMKVLTESAALRDMRREILELILSEHPSSCLICDEQEECRQSMVTIRKAGVSTGCRTCPNDGQCELQAVVEKLGVRDIHYPVYYRGYEAEHDDPFFDRDYNICILCGRCVRMCQEVRGASVLAFKFRGPKTQVGPAFGRSHLESGCEFCGACVSVCPTGTLADKVSKWDGRPDGFKMSTCPFCGLGCQVELHHKNGRLSKVHPGLDPEINDGQLCVRGRFCLPETTHHHQRAKKPGLRRGRYFREVTWAEALDEVASRLKGLGPKDILMVVSSDLTNESLFAAQKFMRACLKSNSIDSTARWTLPGGVGLWASLFSLPISIKAISSAEAIIAVGLDSRFSFSVAGVEVRRALKEGSTLVTIDSNESNLARYTGHWLRPAPEKQGAAFKLLTERLLASGKKKGSSADLRKTGLDEEGLEKAVDALWPARDLAVVVGPAAFAQDGGQDIARALVKLSERPNTTILPLYQGANTRGALELGVFGEFLPGLARAKQPGLRLADVLEGKAKPKVIYLVGEVPFFKRPDCEFIISQDIYHPPFEVDAFLPASSFAEAEGTLTNVEGRVQELVRVEDLPDSASNGFSRPDWFIFGEISKKLSCPGLEYADSKQVLREISRTVAGYPAAPDRRPRRFKPAEKIPWDKPPASPSPAAEDGFRLVVEPGGFRHRGIDLSSVVEGLSELRLEEAFRLHPEDMQRLGLQNGDIIKVGLDGWAVTAPVRADADCFAGAVYIHRPLAYGGIGHRRGLEPLYRLSGDSLRVKIARGEQPAGQSCVLPGPGKTGN
ncbi:MAG: molybdopterin-dependent oxidoreductase [Candidatus Aminicenantales bacterium]